MRDEDKTKERLIEELRYLRNHITEMTGARESQGGSDFVATDEEPHVSDSSVPDLVWNPEDASLPILDDSGHFPDIPRFLSTRAGHGDSPDSDEPSSHVTETGSFDLTWITMDSFGKLLHAVPMPILLMDASGAILLENHAFTTISGEFFSKVGDSVYSLLRPDEEAKQVEHLVQKVLGLRVPQIREGIIDINGMEIWSRMHLRAIRFGAERSILVLIEDLSTEKRELRLNEKYKTLVHTFPIGIAEFALGWDVSGEPAEDDIVSMVLNAHAVSANARFAWLNGYKDVDAVIGTPLHKLLPSTHNDLQLYRRWLHDDFSTHYFETKEKWADGSLRYFETTLVGNVQDDCLVQFWVMKQDITERKKIQEELLQKITTIDELYEHIVQSGKAKAIAEHTATVAHELRQPLAIIGGFARRMAKECIECPGNAEGSKDQWFEVIVNEVQRLEKILGGLIDFSKREDVALSKVNPNDLIEYVLRINEERMEEKNVCLQLNIAVEIGEIPLDPDRFSQVIRNLVANAIEASPPDETISVETRVAVPSDKAVKTGQLASEAYFEMKIQNRGNPVPKEHLEKIFNPFFTTKDFGTGLGLTLSKKIVEDHGGSISVKSDETSTVLTVWVPLRQLPEPGDDENVEID